ncbi:hypothetical protein [Campylobacter sp. CCS1377]|uniref:PH domain-containing protein n=1 Tax=Campylobacter sp. CCS1377 TaxID=3158229 RepID=A0AAU7EAE2_9BACT|nr:hypothetical protein [Campylobacter jejuni]
MERSTSAMKQEEWIKSLKLAIIKEDIESIASLIKTLDPHQGKLEEIRALLQEAIKIVSSKKESIAQDIKKLQRASKYIK